MHPYSNMQPSAPPPPYESVVSRHEQESHSSSYSNRTHAEQNDEYMTKLNQFINRYESEDCFEISVFSILIVCEIL